MTTRLVMLNGRLLPLARARISPDDAGFQFGHGVFETLLARDGAPLFVADHLARLRAGAAALGIAAAIEDGGFRADAAALLAANGLQTGDTRIKIILTPGSAAPEFAAPAPAAPGSATPRPVAGGRLRPHAATPRKPSTVTQLMLAERYRRRAPGACVGLWLPEHAAPASIPGYKTLNYLHHRMLMQQAERLGFDDAVLMDGDGSPVETTTCGLLVHARGAWLAPPLEGRLDSITLRHAIALLRGRGQAVSFERLERETLLAADDVWVMNSLAGVLPVHRINDVALPSPQRAEAEALSAELLARGAD